MHRTLLMALVLASSILVPGPAAVADTRTVDDPRDTPGRLDIRSVTHRHNLDGKLVHRVEMYHRWRNRALRGPYSGINLHFNTDGDRWVERAVNIDFRDGRLVGRMTRERNLESEVLQRVRVRRVDERTVKVVFGRRALRRELDSYRWSVNTSYATRTSDNCWASGDVSMICYDNAPRVRPSVVHDL
jgi:hypothetical protein